MIDIWSLSFQHDVSQTLLKATLDSVVEECVSFVGVDINICSEVLLRWDKKSVAEDHRILGFTGSPVHIQPEQGDMCIKLSSIENLWVHTLL